MENRSVEWCSTTSGIQELASSEQARRVIDWTGRGVGSGRAEGSSAMGDGGRAAISLTPDMMA